MTESRAIRGRPGSRAARAVAVLGAVVAAASVAVLAACSPTATEAGPVAPSDGAPIVAFYGDSYTRGTGASSPERRWSTIIADDRGWYEFNPSVDGLGFVNNRGFGGDLVDRIVELDPPPDIVIVTMGLNDNFSMPAAADDIEAAIGADLQRLRDDLPEARLVVVEPFWYTDERPDSVDMIIEWVASAADRVGADRIEGASRWLEGHPEWMSVDGIHPNDEGYAEIARRMSGELERLGL
ncbi:lysophospholipase L1-like esterase [Agromyces ramosus]|uniref:Lysophospholipase L1-like esterase n=1 Tax=Agromyces ramosus TaxID=33879 RepID=A0A4Q7MJP2_9MICO|nr:SGNH/GDSL hydrolase family protein [Agromyces ramosus]RZS68077.1 lysophospholipase L1-like esterase [Agromyces ramosus]